MMGDLRVLLRYGIAGYMILFFDLIFICSYVDLRNILNVVKDTQLGIVVGIMGLPLGWLCYQIWDQCINRYWIPQATNIKRIKEWEKEIRDQLKIKDSKADRGLPDYTIKVIANISLGYCVEEGQTGSSVSVLTSDPRRIRYSVYSDSLLARGVMVFALPFASYFNYLLIGTYMASKFGFSYVLFPFDVTLYFISIFLPVLVSLICVWGFPRVRREQSAFAWAILAHKENQIKELIETFYKAKDKRVREASKK